MAGNSRLITRMAVTALACATIGLSACTQQLTLHLNPGDCLLLPDSQSIASVTTTPCTEAHHAEVIGTVTLTDSTLPSEHELEARAQKECTPTFESYVGIPMTESAMELMWLLPTEASWKTGDRTITCLAVAPDKQLISQTLKNSKL